MTNSPVHDTAWKKRIALFLVSQNLSLFGSSVVGFAIVWHITLETSSGIWMMLATICTSLPQVFISLFGGVWADRYSRKLLIMLADGFIALATLALALSFLFGYSRPELLLVASVIRSIGAGIQAPAVNAIYPQLVPPDQLTRIQGLNQSLSSVLMLLSPAVGGVLLGGVGIVGAFFVDVVTALLAILLFLPIRVAPVPTASAQSSIFTELREGLAYTFGHPKIRRILVYFSVSIFLITPTAVLTPLMVERTFGSEVWRLTANEVVWTVGSLLGGLFVSLKGQFHNKIRAISICLIAFGVTFTLLGVASPFWLYLVIMGVAGLFMPVIATVQTVYLQELTEPEKMGRVFSVLQLVSGAAMPVAILLFGPLADVVRVETLLIISGAVLAVVGLICSREKL